jgi:hypothetical protein
MDDAYHAARADFHAQLAKCPDCRDAGHICRPCRAKRHHERNRPPSRAGEVFGLVMLAAFALFAFLLLTRPASERQTRAAKEAERTMREIEIRDRNACSVGVVEACQ